MHRKPISKPPKYRVLVIEDDAWIRTFMRDVLSDEGYEVLEAADGRTGIRLVVECSPNIVLLDVAMPEFTGVDVLHHLSSNRRTRRLPVGVMSAYPRVLPANDESSVAGILIKPIYVGTLLDGIRQIHAPEHRSYRGRHVLEMGQLRVARNLILL